MERKIRVQIPAYTDWWMRGARYGEVVKTFRHKTAKDRWGDPVEYHKVKLDIGGKITVVVANDCTEV